MVAIGPQGLDDPEVVILCGGRGTRLAPDTDVIPKPLVKVAGRPILWHIMSHYARHGLKRFVLGLGYKGDLIRDYFLNYPLLNNDFTVKLGAGTSQVTPYLGDVLDWEVTCAETGLDAQTGARVRRVAKYVRSPYFLCTYGDGVSDVDLRALIAFHKQHGRIATVTGVHPPARFGELLVGEDTKVARFAEKPREGPRMKTGYISGGFFVFNREIFDYLSEGDECVLEGNALERLAAEGQLQVYKHEGFWQCMDTPKDRDELDQILSASRPVKETSAGVVAGAPAAGRMNGHPTGVNGHPTAPADAHVIPLAS